MRIVGMVSGDCDVPRLRPTGLEKQKIDNHKVKKDTPHPPFFFLIVTPALHKEQLVGSIVMHSACNLP
jgi:hypothetical protein